MLALLQLSLLCATSHTTPPLGLSTFHVIASPSTLLIDVLRDPAVVRSPRRSTVWAVLSRPIRPHTTGGGNGGIDTRQPSCANLSASLGEFVPVVNASSRQNRHRQRLAFAARAFNRIGCSRILKPCVSDKRCVCIHSCRVTYHGLALR